MASVAPSITAPARPAVPAAPVRLRFAADPRHFQIAALATLLVYGMQILEFPVSPFALVVTVGSCLALQWLATRLAGAGAFEPRSALISALSLALLLRVDDWTWLVVAASIAIGSKFLLRVRRRHFFNPTALAIASLVVFTDHAWVSPGQWGHAALVGLLIAGAGLVIITRAGRLDVALAFAATFSAIVLARTVWLGDPLAIAAHQLSSGALALFTLFMLTDPRTTPDTRAGRIVFATAVASVGAWLIFGHYRADGLILALAGCAPLVPIINATFDFKGGHRS